MRSQQPITNLLISLVNLVVDPDPWSVSPILLGFGVVYHVLLTSVVCVARSLGFRCSLSRSIDIFRKTHQSENITVVSLLNHNHMSF